MKSFSELGLEQQLLNAIVDLGFVTPTPIQAETIPLFLNSNNDIIGLAQTGTGKTAAFGLPLLQLVNRNDKKTQAVILCPTRELCVQITNDLKDFSKYIEQVNIVSVYGGASIRGQIMELKNGAHIVVATPGRLMDLMERKAVNLSNVKYAVLDEADEMLKMGFREDIEYILGYTPGDKRSCLFSATMPKEVKEIIHHFLMNPVEIKVARVNSLAENLEHEYAVVHARDKYAALKRIIDFNTDFYGMVFCTTKIETQEISDKLIRDGYSADCLHGDLSQPQREKTLNKFRHRAIQVMLATDVAARGIDVEGLTHVIHYHLPDEFENYTHRSGRTARAGKSGVSYTLLNVKEFYKLMHIEKSTGIKFKRTMIPSAMEIRDKKLLSAVNRINLIDVDENQFDHQDVQNAFEVLQGMDKETLIRKILSFELNRFSEEYMKSPDLNVHDKQGDSDDGGIHTKLFISLGKKDGFTSKSMKDFVAKYCGLEPKDILFADVGGVYSFVKVDEQNGEKVMTGLNGGTYGNRPVRVEYTETRPPSRNKSGKRSFDDRDRRNSNKGRRGGSGGGRRGKW